VSRAYGMSNIHYLEHATSTQDVLHGLAADGAPAGTAVVAAEQGAGRGSRGRQWHSPLGGLWLSVLLRPLRPVGVEVLSLRVGLAVADALDGLPGLPVVELKWPNDILLAGRKVGGILCEARWQGDRLGWIAVGVGLNVANPLPLETAMPAVRLADYNSGLAPEALAEPVAKAIRAITADDPRLDAVELAAFAARDWLRGRPLRAPVRGRGAGIAPDGALIVRTPEGDREVRAGSVVLEAAVEHL